MSDYEEETQLDQGPRNDSFNYDLDDGQNYDLDEGGNDGDTAMNNSVYHSGDEEDQGAPLSTDQGPPLSKDQGSRYSTDHGTRFSTAPVRAPISNLGAKPLSVIAEENSICVRSSEDERLPAGGGEPPETSANASTWSSDGFVTSLGGPSHQEANCSADFAKGADALKVIEQAEELFNKSGRRLCIPDGYDLDNAAPVADWEKDIPVNKASDNQLDSKNKYSDPVNSVSTSKPPTRVKDAEMPKPTPVTPVQLPQMGTPQKAIDASDLHATPVRPKSHNSFRREATFSSSTPKAGAATKLTPPDFGDVSAINLTMESTMGAGLSDTQLAKTWGKVGPKASVEEIMAALENLRTGKAAKAEERERSMVEFRAKASGRMPLKGMQPEKPSRQREVDISMPQSSRMSSTASTCSMSTAVGRSLHSSSRITNAETVSDVYSRASSVASMRDCGSRPDTRMSIASAYSSDEGNTVKVDRTTLSFSYVDMGQTFVDSLRISNRGHVPLTLTLSLRKEKSGYTILDGTTRQLEAGREMDIRIEFSPVIPQAHNNSLYIKTNASQEFKIWLRGLGGAPSVSIEPTREKITKNKYGIYLMKPIRDDGLLQFKLKSSGSKNAFCKVVVFGDGQILKCNISPVDAIVLKPGTEQLFQVAIHDIGRYITSNSRGSTVSLASSADGGENIRLKMIVFWGDNRQRQRAQHFLKKYGTSVQDPIIQTLMESKFLNETEFKEPSEWHVMRADVKNFEMGLNKAEIVVLPLAVSRLSNMDDFDDTLVSDSTFTDRNMMKERTFAPDSNDTIMPSR